MRPAGATLLPVLASVRAELRMFRERAVPLIECVGVGSAMREPHWRRVGEEILPNVTLATEGAPPTTQRLLDVGLHEGHVEALSSIVASAQEEYAAAQARKSPLTRWRQRANVP